MKKLFLVPALLLGACVERPQPTQTMVAQSAGRFTVQQVGVFEDSLSYDGRRGIYVIVDSTTGQEFVGVSGIGISQLGSHLNGKSTVSDER